MPTEAQKRARDKWDAEHMANVVCKIRADVAADFRTLAERNGTTRNALIRGWIMDYIAQHKTDQGAPQDQQPAADRQDAGQD